MPKPSDIKLYEYKNIPLSSVRIRPDNPQQMTDSEFNHLVQNIQEEGFLEPILVAKGHYEGDVLLEKDTVYEAISGAHRVKGGVVSGMQIIPALIMEECPESKRVELMIRLNVIKGTFDKVKFTALVNKIVKGDEYSGLIEAFMMDRDEFETLYQSARSVLPPEIRAKLPETGEEIKTIDNLARILNRMFSTYGETLPYGFMIVDFGGKDSVWIKANKGLWNKVTKIRDYCMVNKTDINDIMERIIVNSSEPEIPAIIKEAD